MACLGVFVLGASFTATILQAVRLIPEHPACGACEIVVGPRRLTLDDTSTTRQLSGLLTTTADGRYLAGTRSGPPLVFSAEGRLERGLGRRGAGPREFRGVTAIVSGPGDSIAIVDAANGRVQVLDPDLRFVRAFRIEQSVVHGGILWLPGTDAFLMGGSRYAPSDTPFTIHSYAGDGGHLWGAAETATAIRPGASQLGSYRLLCAIGADEVLAVSAGVAAGAYTIETVSLPSRTVVARYRRESKWLESRPGPFPSRVMSAWVDSTGLLWTLSAVREERWERGVRKISIGRGGSTETGYQVTDRDRVADTLIEVIDLAAGRLVAQHRIDRVYLGRLPNGLLVAERQDQTGFDLMPVHLKPATR